MSALPPPGSRPGIACGLCGGARRRVVLLACGYRLARCARCGLVYNLDFSPRDADYQTADYYTTAHPYVAFRSRFLPYFRRLVARIAAFRRGGRFLDIGAGTGLLLATARSFGYEPLGVEVSAWAARHAREVERVPIVQARLEAAGLAPESCDVVSFHHCLEHLPAPVEALASARRLLRPGGVLFVGVPNWDSLWRRIKGGAWATLQPTEHAWHFTRETLRHLGERAGFLAVDVRVENAADLLTGVKKGRLIALLQAWTGTGDNLAAIFRKPPGPAAEVGGEPGEGGRA
ncbi:MAG: class I SAM-dependent methyltransferase [Planctomycetes bacterium]|nr:class I SAM-dependent methyltransferase [Planctomycetota bacterium]